MKKLTGFILFISLVSTVSAQKKNRLISGMYIQWGYNTEWYTKSKIHFNSIVDGVPHNFTIFKAKAHDRSDMDGILKKPLEITVPQYNYRVGFYLNKKHTNIYYFITIFNFLILINFTFSSYSN